MTTVRSVLGSARRFAIFLALISIASAFNWCLPYTEMQHSAVFNSPVDLLQSSQSEVRSFVAGWPLKYYFRMEYLSGPPLVQFSWLNLSLNVLAWTSVYGLAFAYELRMRRQRREGPTPLRRHTILDIFCLTAAIALACAYWGLLDTRAKASKAMSQRIEKSGGSVVQATYLPTFLANSEIYGFVKERFVRIRKVSLVNPDSSMVSDVIKIPSLTMLRIGGGDYDLRLLDALASKTNLTELRISGRKLDSQFLSMLSSMKQLQTLNLSFTNVTAAGVKSLGEMPRLSYLSLVHTDVRNSELGDFRWAPVLTRLDLPHPSQGGNDRFSLHNHPNLSHLMCSEFNEPLNKNAMQIELSNLPKLKAIQLDSLQKFDLTLNQLPEVEEVTNLEYSWRGRANASQIVPSKLWVRNVKISHAPKLKEFVVFGRDVESICFDNMGDLTFGIGVFGKTTNANLLSRTQESYRMIEPNGRSYYEAYLDSTKIPLETRQGWVDELGKCAGPTTVDLAAIPLEDVNLKPLVANLGIRTLDLSNTNTTPSQISSLAGMGQLERLQIYGCLLDGKTIENLLLQMPKLQMLMCDLHAAHRLRLEKHQHLVSLFNMNRNPQGGMNYGFDGIPILSMDAIKLVELPNLQDRLRFMPTLNYVLFDSIPSVRGLQFDGPMPKGASVKGLRDLAYFVGGGKWLDDSIASELLNCRKLEKLTLAYSSVSPAVIEQLLDLPELTYLVLAGSKVNEKAITKIGRLEKLTAINLDDTAVDDTFVDAIIKLPNLKILSLVRTRVSSDSFEKLASINSLQQIGISGMEMTAGRMQMLANLSSLTALELTQSKMDVITLAPFVAAPPRQLKMLSLRGCSVDGPSLVKLSNQLNQLTFDLTDAEVDPRSMDTLMARHCVRLDSERSTGFQPIYMSGVNQPSGLAIDGHGLPATGEANPRLFRDNSSTNVEINAPETANTAPSKGGYWEAISQSLGTLGQAIMQAIGRAAQ